MSILVLLLIVFLVLSILGAPGLVWQHSYGYWPSGVGGLIVLILVIWLLMGGR